MLNVQRLVLLDELERRGTLAAVARALSYSPSAVSQQLAQLEREAGVALTEPVGRGVRLTDAGRILVDHARVAIAALEDAETALAVAQGRVGGRLRVASFQTVLLSLLPAALDALERDHPELRVDIAQREADAAMTGLLTGGFDVVLGEEYPGEPFRGRPDMHRVDLGVDEVFLAVPTCGPWSEPARLADLAAAPWALDPLDSAPGRWARELCRANGFEPQARFDGVDLLVHVQMVESGRAVALVPALLGLQRLHGVRLCRLPGAPKRQLFTLARAAYAEHPSVTAFRAALGTGFEARESRMAVANQLS